MSYKHAEHFYQHKSNLYEIIMQTIKYESGIWNIEARIQQAGANTRMAIVSAMAGTGDDSIESKHTVVFEHRQGCDEVAEAKECVRRIVQKGN